jgi:hypothetical protein
MSRIERIRKYVVAEKKRLDDIYTRINSRENEYKKTYSNQIYYGP